MLKRLTANQDCFKPIKFDENSLNLIIATKNDKSAPTASRNGLGKSTFVNVVAFCLGLDVDTKKDLPLDELKEWEWSLTFTNGKKDFTVTRGASKPEVVSVKGDLTGCPIIGTSEAVLGEGISMSYKVEDWEKVLRWIFFGLSPASGDGDSGDAAPDYQSLMSRFVRRDFDDPIRVNPGDKITTSEMAITYLLGLDWQFLAGAKEVRKMKNEADALMSVARSEIALHLPPCMSQMTAKRLSMKASLLTSSSNASRLRSLSQMSSDRSSSDPQIGTVQYEPGATISL